MKYPSYSSQPEPPEDNNQPPKGYPQYPNYMQGQQPPSNEGSEYDAGAYGDPNPLEPGDGSINVMAAVQYAGKRWASHLNWLTWGLLLLVPVVLGVVVTVVAGIGGLAGDDATVFIAVALGLAILVISILVSFWMYRGAVVQSARLKIQFSDFTFNARIGSQLLLAVLAVLIAVPLGLLILSITGAGPQGEGSIVGVIVFIVVGLLLAPFFALTPYFVADGHGVVGAIRDGISAGRGNWGKLLLYIIVEYVVLQLVFTLTLGIGALVALPLSMMMRGHMARQFNGGPIPLGTNQ